MGERIRLASVVAGAMNAFPVMEGHGPAYGICKTDYERLMAFLAQAKEDQDRLKLALAACEALIAADGPDGNLDETKLDEAVGLARQALGR